MFDESVKALAANLEDLFRRLKADGTVGMAMSNVRAIVSTRGVRVPVSAFERCMDEALKLAKTPRGFRVY